MLKYILLICLFYESNCFVNINNINKAIISNVKHHNLRNLCLMKEDSFNDIDIDKSGKLDKTELELYYGKINYMDIADLNKDEELDYLEFERLKNIKKFGNKNGGNLYVRNAINFGILAKNSILSDGEASIILGNKGFDPLNCSTNINTLKKYREAETKHGRLAMLACVGWPLSEIYHPYLSKMYNLPNLLSDNGRVPSILNGGLDKINPVFFMAVIIFATTLEFPYITKKYDKNSITGDLGFDPLKLYKDRDVVSKIKLELKELNNGRIAMLAITYFAFNEFITNTPITKNAEFFFNSFL
jgi:hypothetical protein